MKKLSVLFIDDDMFMLKALQRTARRAQPNWDFYICEDALSWQDALPHGVLPDAIFCDYLMPEKNGDELLEEIAAIIPSSVRVLLTGDTAEDVVSKVSEVSHFVLKKPFAAADLEDVFFCLERLDSLNFSLEMRNKLGRIGYFFPLPEIAAQLRTLFAIDEVDIGQTADLIKQEAFIAAKIIQIANSAFLGYHSKTVSLEEAIKRLGLKMTETIVISMLVNNCIAPKLPIEIHKKVNEWAFNYSKLSRQLSQSLGFKAVQLDNVFIASLLSGIGRLVFIAEANEFINIDADDNKMILDEATSLTVYILTLWGYPLELCQIILMQDKPDFAAKGLTDQKLGLIMYVVKVFLSGQLDEFAKSNLKTLIEDVDIIDWIDNC